MTGRGWDVEADLEITVDDGTGATTTAWLTGTGSDLTLTAGRPEVLVAAAGRGSTGMLADGLAAAGARVELRGPGGRVAVLDPRHTSRAAGLMLGNRHLSVDPAGWGVLARAAARSRPGGWGPAALLTVTAAIGAAVLCWLLCRAPGSGRKVAPDG